MNTEIANLGLKNLFTDGIKRFALMGSPLYSSLCRHISDDADVLAMIAKANTTQPHTHLLFAAVHMLILETPNVPLGLYYASVTKQPKQDHKEAFAAFKAFFTERLAEILEIMNKRTVQFTAAGRAAFVLPVVAYAAAQAGEPLSLIDVGCSAGLMTCFADYDYDYGSSRRIGESGSLTISGFQFERDSPAFLTRIPKIGERIGIDLDPVDPTDPKERRWVDAFCPPDMSEERRQLRNALDLRARTPLRVIKSDALTVLPKLLASLPNPICVLIMHCLYQWPVNAREALDGQLRAASAGRTLYCVIIDVPAVLNNSRIADFTGGSVDGMPPMPHEATLIVYHDGQATKTLLGYYDGFGKKGLWLAG
jgi:hypothetical protein